MLSIDIALYHQETVKMNGNFKTVEAESKKDLVVILEDEDNKKYLYLLPRVFNYKDNVYKSLTNFIATAFPNENVTESLSMTVEDYGDYIIKE